ncbi:MULTISPECIES: hypothetical protein [Bacillaceae]|jgi:hypothetical protein|uniref:hypothetical protein n=1 Tax=Bacillaceae TaxID=186817 RepID=UPI001D0607DE|nr:MULTISPECIES: hypothetical protein [Caldibacillus]
MPDVRWQQGLRISLSEERRIITPIDRSNYKWKGEFNSRTAVERVTAGLIPRSALGFIQFGNG